MPAKEPSSHMPTLRTWSTSILNCHRISLELQHGYVSEALPERKFFWLMAFTTIIRNYIRLLITFCYLLLPLFAFNCLILPQPAKDANPKTKKQLKTQRTKNNRLQHIQVLN
jgi:hypothetical protein